ncbi:MAG: FHA domain-containing protein [Deltaproteobacteria bacterium]|nr:FHA domain-containing protein [Deltaproteobacteria bacterium]
MPDRTRVEASPFVDGAEKPRGKGGSRPGRQMEAAPSIIVDEALDAESAPPPASHHKSTNVQKAAGRKNGNDSDPDWDVPSSEDSGATRIAPAPERRPSRADRDDATSAGPPISVEVIAGPDRGVRLPIRGGRMIVGRGDGCDLKLTDTSVSRRHLELTAGLSGVVLRDLGSGNGTRVNGQREVEVELAHGDEIALGDTVFKIIDELKRHDEERAPPPARRNSVRSPAAQPQEEAESDAQPESEAGAEAEGKVAAEPEAEAESDDEGPADAVAAVEAREATGKMDVPPPRHLPPRSRPGLTARFAAMPRSLRLGLIVGAALLLLLLLVVATLSALKPKPIKGADEEGGKASVVPNRDREYADAYQEARSLYDEKKYDKALAQAEEAQAIKKTSEAGRLIFTIKAILEAKASLEAAERLASTGDYDKAIERLKEIDDSSELSEDAKALIKKLSEEKAKASMESVRKACSEGEFDTARQLISQVPFDHQDGMRLEVVDAEAAWKRDAVQRERQRLVAIQQAKAAKLQRQRQEIDEGIVPIVRKLDVGDFDGAVRQCDRVLDANPSALVAAKVRMLKKTIPTFGIAYNDGMSRYHGGSYEAAASSLQRALKLFEDMDCRSGLEKQLLERTGQALAFKGRAAANRQDYGTAARAYKDALRINPNSKEAKDGLALLRRNAEDVYREGYMLRERDPDAARKRFRDVIEMVPAGDELAAKAQGRIDDIDGR